MLGLTPSDAVRLFAYDPTLAPRGQTSGTYHKYESEPARAPSPPDAPRESSAPSAPAWEDDDDETA
jgi:hypothetical protein